MFQKKANRVLALVEGLEDRRLLSAALSGGALLVSGTRRSDTIDLHTGGRHGKFTYVTVDGQAQQFSTPAVKSISVIGGKGNDRIALGDNIAPASGVDVAGGDDNDSIQGGGGNETLDGGNGNDSVVGGDGNDSVVGGPGDDHCMGGIGNDTINGGDGNDQLQSGGGNDLLDGDGGTDTCIGGPGHDTLVGGTGDNLQPGPHGMDHHDPNEDGGGGPGGPGGQGGPGGPGDDLLGQNAQSQPVFAA